MFNRRNGMFWLELLIVVVAGVWTLFHIRWAMIGNTTDDYWGIALLILFALSLILAFVHFARERSALRATATNESFPEPSISRFFLASIGSSALWFVVRMNVGAQWFLAGWEKVTSPAWGTSGKALTGFVAGALAKTSGTNPSVQGWYAWFLQYVVLLPGVPGLFLVLSWRVCGWIGLDRWLLPALGLPWKPGALFRNQETMTPETKTSVPR